jgi:hypothetical protein
MSDDHLFEVRKAYVDLVMDLQRSLAELTERVEDLETDMQEYFDAKNKRKKYMRNYMRKRREQEASRVREGCEIPAADAGQVPVSTETPELPQSVPEGAPAGEPTAANGPATVSGRGRG